MHGTENGTTRNPFRRYTLGALSLMLSSLSIYSRVIDLGHRLPSSSSLNVMLSSGHLLTTCTWSISGTDFKAGGFAHHNTFERTSRCYIISTIMPKFLLFYLSQFLMTRLFLYLMKRQHVRMEINATKRLL